MRRCCSSSTLSSGKLMDFPVGRLTGLTWWKRRRRGSNIATSESRCRENLGLVTIEVRRGLTVIGIHPRRCLTIVRGVREAPVVLRRGRQGPVCARGACPAWSSGPSTSPLGGALTVARLRLWQSSKVLTRSKETEHERYHSGGAGDDCTYSCSSHVTKCKCARQTTGNSASAVDRHQRKSGLHYCSGQYSSIGAAGGGSAAPTINSLSCRLLCGEGTAGLDSYGGR